MIHREPDDVKNVYLTEGTLFLRKKLEAPGPEEREEKKYPEPLDLKLRKEHDENEGRKGQVRKLDSQVVESNVQSKIQEHF
jgi:hypothetical protein